MESSTHRFKTLLRPTYITWDCVALHGILGKWEENYSGAPHIPITQSSPHTLHGAPHTHLVYFAQAHGSPHNLRWLFPRPNPVCLALQLHTGSSRQIYPSFPSISSILRISGRDVARVNKTFFLVASLKGTKLLWETSKQSKQPSWPDSR
jgi:hypothetical protein